MTDILNCSIKEEITEINSTIERYYLDLDEFVSTSINFWSPENINRKKTAEINIYILMGWM